MWRITKMKPFLSCISLAAFVGIALSAPSQTLVYNNQTIPGNSEIAGAGNAGLPDSSGVAPIEFDLPAYASVFTMISASGTITLNSRGGSNDADGVIVSGSYGLSLPNASYASAYGGISGIKQPGAGAIIGVFEPATAPTGAAPPTLDFTVIGKNFTSFAPLLYQLFYIGDGLTGDGSGTVQQFNVPPGATRLFLGISDAPGFDGNPGAYSDNSGAFIVSFQIAASSPTPIPSPAANLINGLLAYYPMNGNAVDASGNGYNGTSNAVTATTNRFDQAVQALAFNATSSTITVADAVPLRLATTDFSLAVWVFETNRNAGYQDCIVSKRGSGVADGWLLSLTGSGGVGPGPGHFFYQISGGYDPYMASSAGIPLNQWHHLVAVYHSGSQTMQMFIDGALDTAVSGTLPPPNAATTNAMTIGNDTGSYIFNGNLDDLRIYSRALAPAEILALFNGGLAFTSVQAGGGWFTATVAGVWPGERAVFQSSTDAVTWTPFQTNLASGLTLYFTHPINPASPALFFQAVGR